MGCGGSKAASAYELTTKGMGNVGRSWDEMMSSKPAKLSVMTGHWEVAPDRIDGSHHVSLGEGDFGMVYEGRVKGIGLNEQEIDSHPDRDVFHTVVIKKLQPEPPRPLKLSFLKEIQHMKEIDHPSIFKLVGIVTQIEPLMMMFEHFPNGTLKAFLQAHRGSPLLTTAVLSSMGENIASGLAFLAEHGVVHGDMAARNCLVTANLRAKIGDYGLSRQKFSSDYYSLEEGQEEVPVRWMAPEVLEKEPPSAASDVWSLGIVLWELFSFANTPYPALSNAEVKAHVCGGSTLDRPKDAPPALEDMFNGCWLKEASGRSTAAELAPKLRDLCQIEGGFNPDDFEGMQSRSASISSNVRLRVNTASTANGAGRTSYLSTVPDEAYDMPQDALHVLGSISGSTTPANASREPTPLMRHRTKSKAMRSTEIDRARVKLGKPIGQGAFGDVCLGKLTREDNTVVDCACKTLKDKCTQEDKEALLDEAKLVMSFDHPNVVACYGQVMVGEPKMIIFEFMGNGSLFDWLNDNGESALLKTKLKMAIDIARGMRYLSELNHVHRDLAARNVLVSSSMVCKISDFGLSRDLQDQMYYQSEGGMVPVRWTPPESYKYKKYSSASDVWSFGVVLYEIFTNAALPYGKNWSNLNVMVEVECGYRLPPPPGCPRAIYKVMMQSWNPHRQARPSFGHLVSQMELAYDMLFPAEADEPAAPTSGEDCNDLATVYLGVPVPGLETLDDNAEVYLAPGMDLLSEEKVKPPPVPIRESIKRASGGSGNPSAATANRMSAYEYSSDGMEALLPGSKKKPVPTIVEGEVSRSHSFATRAGSFRKQKESAAHGANLVGVEYVSNSTVEEVLRLAREREKISRAEVTGLTRTSDPSIATESRPKYIEQVGRATDVKATAAIKGRGQCKCRRFKCVCNLEAQ